jgi:hypothetical protein
MKFYFSHFCLAVLFFTLSIGAQEIAEAKSKSTSEQKVSALIEDILLETPLLESKENRITLSTLMVDLLWSRDEKRARQLAVETADLLRLELAPKDESRSMTQFPPLRYGDLRDDFLIILVRHDLAFAQEMKRYTLPLMPKLPPVSQSEKNQLRNWNNDERELEQQMAFQAAAKNIVEAQKLANRSLSLGITNESLNVLRRFHIKDSATADTFAAELIEKLIASDFAKNDKAQETAAVFLFQIDEEKGVFGMPRSCNCPAKPLNLDQQKIRTLASKWLDFVVASNEENLFNDFLSAMSVLQKLLPERNTAIQAKFAAIKKARPERVENAQLREQFFDDKTTPETIALMALKKEGNEKFHLYRQAFIKAANNSKPALEKLLLAISGHPDSEEKNWLIDQIHANLSGKTVEEGDLDKALQMANKVVSRDRRLGLLSFLALEFLEKGDNEKVKQISDEIAVLLDFKNKDKLPKAIVGYDIFSTIFRTFALIDPERAFMLLENVLPESNDLFSDRFAASNVDKRIDVQRLLKQNAYILDSYAKPIKNLSEFDFERMRNLSKYLNKPELSIASKLLLAQSLTDKNLGFGFIKDRQEMIIIRN